MSDPFVALLMLGLFIVFIFLGFPIAFTMMAMGMGFGFYAYFTPDQLIWDNRILYLFTQNTFSVMNNDVLISIPLFLFMGYIIERANILDKLFLSLQVGLRALPGSMAVAALVTCTLFATATGIVGAVVALMGLIALPAMLKAGYDEKLASGVITAGGTLGILIPPSILLIVYAATASVEVQVESLGKQTRFGQMVTLMESASVSKPSMALIADKVAKPFLWGVLLAAGLAALWGWQQADGSRIPRWFWFIAF